MPSEKVDYETRAYACECKAAEHSQAYSYALHSQAYRQAAAHSQTYETRAVIATVAMSLVTSESRDKRVS